MSALTEKERTALTDIVEWYLAPTDTPDDDDKCALTVDWRRDAAARRALRKLKNGRPI